jgi:hypothetical protein
VEILEVRISLQKSVLHSIFGVLLISRDIPRETENLVLIAVDELLECRDFALLGGCNQEVLVLTGDR